MNTTKRPSADIANGRRRSGPLRRGACWCSWRLFRQSQTRRSCVPSLDAGPQCRRQGARGLQAERGV